MPMAERLIFFLCKSRQFSLPAAVSSLCKPADLSGLA
jgi:hypothetical protein